MDDILDMMESSEQPFKKEKEDTNVSYKSNNNKKNLFEATDIDMVKIDPEKLNKPGATFGITTFNNGEALPDNIMEQILAICKTLFSRGYAITSNGSNRDEVLCKISELEGAKIATYLPFKKFNEDIKFPLISKPTETAYGIAASVRKNFFELKPVVRCLIATDIHTMLGVECNDPLKFLIVYTPEGSESLSKNSDWKQMGYTTLKIRVASESNIPVFNLKNPDAIKRLSELIKK